MKKIYSSVLIYSCIIILTSLTITQLATAQVNVSGSDLIPVSALRHGVAHNPDHASSVTDTLQPPVLSSGMSCADSIYYYTYTNGAGYVTGNSIANNGALRKVEIAQRYAFTGTATINDVLVWYAKVVGQNGITLSNIYNVSNTTKKPTTLIATSTNTLTTGNITTTPYTDYFFQAGVPVTTDFAVSVVFPNPSSGDTVVVWQTRLNCHSIDSLSSAHYKDSAGTGTFNQWYLYTYLTNSVAPNDSSLDLYILPVVDITIGINEYASSNGLTLRGAFPNPASTSTTINYAVEKATQAGIEVFDLQGRVYRSLTESVTPGPHQFKLDIKDLAAGTYFYIIKTREASMTSKFSVVK